MRTHLLMMGTLAAIAGCDFRVAGQLQAVGDCSPAPALLPNALCLCDRLGDVGSLTVGLGTPGAGGVGVDGDSDVRHSVWIEGSWVSGGRMSFSGSARVDGALRSAGPMSIDGDVEVAGDLAVGGDLSGQGSVTVGGALAVAGAAQLASVQAGGKTAYAPVAAPCPCGAGEVLDVAGAVAFARTHNDDAVRGLGPTPPTGPVTLATGTYYFATPPVAHLTIAGNVSLYVDGDWNALPDGAIELRQGATLDLYVAGSLRSVGAVLLAEGASPGAFRLYLGGAEQVALGAEIFGGAIYAPHAVLSYTGATVVRGAIFARSLAGLGAIEIDPTLPARTPGCEPGDDGGGYVPTPPIL